MRNIYLWHCLTKVIYYEKGFIISCRYLLYGYGSDGSVRSDLQSDRLQQVSAFYLLGRIINPYAHSCWITNPAEQEMGENYMLFLGV